MKNKIGTFNKTKKIYVLVLVFTQIYLPMIAGLFSDTENNT
jgi:hypothetical protein